MKVVFRADASRTIGHGHIMRTLTLASALREHGAAVAFVSREHVGHLCDVIDDLGSPVFRLPASTGVSQADAPPAHAAWLGTTWQEDAEQTRAAIDATGEKPDWLVVDHYAIDARWEDALRPSVGRIMAIDDLADRRHNCDLLLDQNLVAQMKSRYSDKVPAACGMLLGPEYALLQPIYAELHERARPRGGPIRRIFIFFGGADHDNLTGRSLAAFMRLNRSDIEVDVVMTADSPHAAALGRQVAGRTNLHLHSGLSTLAHVVARADLGIGAGGATSLERVCLGLPSLVVTSAENQRPLADGLSRHDLIRWLGHKDEVDESTLSHALGELIQEGVSAEWSQRCLAALDGKGVTRVCAALTVTASTPLRARHARPEDEALLLEWANDPTTRQNAFSQAPITGDTHRKWFRDRLSDVKSCHIYLVETASGVPVGEVRFDRADHAWEIDYALAPHFRGRGLGRRMLEAAMLKLCDEEPSAVVLGRVKESNQPSCRVFESLGFAAQTYERYVEYRRVL